MFTGLLVHLCTVQEREDTTDRFGQASGTWGIKSTQGDIPCRLRAATGKEITTMATRDKLQVTHVVYLDSGADITELDRIVNVKEQDDTELVADLSVVLVKSISKGVGGRHHLEVWCETIKNND